MIKYRQNFKLLLKDNIIIAIFKNIFSLNRFGLLVEKNSIEKGFTVYNYKSIYTNYRLDHRLGVHIKSTPRKASNKQVN